MALFDEKSRYVNPPQATYAAIDSRGREVRVMPVPEPSAERAVGRYVQREGQTLGQLAQAYLNDPHAYWRFCDVNDALLPDALAEVEVIDIPDPIR